MSFCGREQSRIRKYDSPNERGFFMYGQNFNPYNPAFNNFNAQMTQQQIAQQRLMQMQPPVHQQQSDLQFVNGRESADMYVMPPNSKTILMDSNRARFYLKETDAAGMAKVTAYDFQAATDAPEASKDFVTRTEFEELRKQYESLVAAITKPDASAKAKPLGSKQGDAGNDSVEG